MVARLTPQMKVMLRVILMVLIAAVGYVVSGMFLTAGPCRQQLPDHTWNDAETVTETVVPAAAASVRVPAPVPLTVHTKLSDGVKAALAKQHPLLLNTIALAEVNTGFVPMATSLWRNLQSVARSH